MQQMKASLNHTENLSFEETVLWLTINCFQKFYKTYMRLQENCILTFETGGKLEVKF